ncbi:MarR family winged helix-turn-helix transcriptional regulator [Streptomyces sp. NPDC057199]|uniref:MarR family winged helix-turn-helix transcriptional regulator n=1 Tax=Streptomyces sp. NPDC057199 TaxID=3346047 RepID=UPI003645BD67
MGELAQLLGVAKNALSGLVDRTERRGLVQRETLQRDRRAVTLSTTALGKKIVDALYADVAQRMPDIAGALPADEQHQFANSVAHITAHLTASSMLDAASQGRQRTVAGTGHAGK